MKTRHRNELLQVLEAVVDLGCGVIRKERLKMWYGAERIAKGTYEDIYERWTEDLEQVQPLFIAESLGEYVLVWGQGLTASSDSWLKDIRTKAGIAF